MAAVKFRSAVSEPWASLQPVRVGKLPPGVGTPDRYVIVDAGETLLRVDVYIAGYECGAPFEEVLVWREFVVIGCCHHVFLVPLHHGSVRTIDLGSYFSQLHLKDDVLLVASNSRLLRLSDNGEVTWTSPELGVDGVAVDRIQDGTVYGQGEWDPPGERKLFAVKLDSGERVA